MQQLLIALIVASVVSASYLKWELETTKAGTGFDAASLKVDIFFS